MKLIFTVLIIFCFFSSKAQFGFQRIDTIDVIKNALPQNFPWAGGLDYVQMSNIDLNYDGVQDLFIFDRTCHKVLTFIQNGNAGQMDFVYAPEYETLFPEMTNWALLVDYDCDGDKDLYTYTIGGVRVYENVGNNVSGLQFQIAKNILKTNVYGNDVYMYVSSVDVPAILDIDNDGDVDILAFGVGGSSIEYQRNMSVESYGVCDSLEFITGNICWGLFKESATSNTILLNEPCVGQVGNPYSTHPDDNQNRHAGSTILALDMNANGVMDVVLGDISYNTLTMLINSGTAPNQNSAMISQDNSFPSNTTPVNLPIYPGAFYVDINNDNVRDLIVSPASTIGSENEKSVWSYENLGADNQPNFNFLNNNFLQGQMIDFGSGAYPVYFDHNGDGLKDLLVSIQGKYDSNSSNQISKIAYFQNTGTLNQPQFTFITDDYQNISLLGIGTNINYYPTFGDLDNDGDEDMILGEYTGYCYYFENTGGAGNSAIFNSFSILNTSDATALIDGIYPIPKLVDIDRDNDLDLILGKRDGKLNYYENIGDENTFNFKLKNSFFGEVNVTETGFIEGRAVPEFVDIDGEYHLIVGSKQGNLFYYNTIENNLNNPFNLVSSNLGNINIGSQSAPAIFDLTNDNKLEMIVGNKRGGVALYKSAIVSEVGLNEIEFNYKIYPNPTNNILNIELPYLNSSQLNKTIIKIVDLYGKNILQKQILTKKSSINLSHLSAGFYLVQITINNKTYTQKLIIK